MTGMSKNGEDNSVKGKRKMSTPVTNKGKAGSNGSPIQKQPTTIERA